MTLCEDCLNYNPETGMCKSFGERATGGIIICTEKKLKHSKRGTWVFDSDGVVTCSECGEHALQKLVIHLHSNNFVDCKPVRSNYCPYCGAYMMVGVVTLDES
jgi:hypothetical protein